MDWFTTVSALVRARDYVGTGLACTWRRLSPNHLTYVDVGNALLSVDRDLTGGKYRETILENFLWREIASLPPARKSMVLRSRGRLVW